MDNIEKVYHDLTNVDIGLQRILWDERGKGYYGEYLVFRELYPTLPGTCKILMNLQIPTSYGKTTEIDLLLIHETGLYVFEIKHYKGTIYGKSQEARWTQYFRTAANHSFKNPVQQNQYHIRALQAKFPQLPIYSYIVFTNSECDLRVENNDPNLTICKLSSLNLHMMNIPSRPFVLNIHQIDGIFQELQSYSPIMRQPVTVDGQVKPFYEYITEIISEHKARMAEWEKQYTEKKLQCETDYQTKSQRTMFAAILLSVAVLLGGSLICAKVRNDCNEKVNEAQQQLSAFAQKFEHVEEYNNGDIIISDSLIEVSDVSVVNASDIENCVIFSCTLNWVGEEYGIKLTDDTKYIIMLNDGTIKEYDLFTSDFTCYPIHKLGKGFYSRFPLPSREFYNMDVSEISYIKLTNLGVWKYSANYNNVLFYGYEIELYNAT